ncbi:MAG: hypothetical protein F6K58_27860 [Symploca sp. SIO2E9]|nr:hypothetical protein [Symploca sp. SIO2E9]
MGRWGDGEMGRWGDGEMGGWGDGEMGECKASFPQMVESLTYMHNRSCFSTFKTHALLKRILVALLARSVNPVP